MNQVPLQLHSGTVLKSFDPVPNTQRWSGHIAVSAPSGEAFDFCGYSAELEVADSEGAVKLRGSTTDGTLTPNADGLEFGFDASAMKALPAGKYVASVCIRDKNGLVEIDPVRTPLLIVRGRD